MVTTTALVCASVPAQAQNRGPPVIRDAETEQLLREYTQPILRSAGLAQQNVQVVIINDRSFNAFVADGRRIFVNGGALMDSETPNQIIGVLAHETGHIAGGHLSRLREALAAATTQSIIAMILGVGAMVAAGRSGASGMGQAGAATRTRARGDRAGAKQHGDDHLRLRLRHLFAHLGEMAAGKMAGFMRHHADDLVRGFRLQDRAVVHEDAASIGHERVEHALVDDHHLDVLFFHAGGAQDRPRVIAQQLLRLGVAEDRWASILLRQRRHRREGERDRRGQRGQFQ